MTFCPARRWSPPPYLRLAFLLALLWSAPPGRTTLFLVASLWTTACLVRSPIHTHLTFLSPLASYRLRFVSGHRPRRVLLRTRSRERDRGMRPGILLPRTLRDARPGAVPQPVLPLSPGSSILPRLRPVPQRLCVWQRHCGADPVLTWVVLRVWVRHARTVPTRHVFPVTGFAPGGRLHSMHAGPLLRRVRADGTSGFV